MPPLDPKGGQKQSIRKTLRQTIAAWKQTLRKLEKTPKNIMDSSGNTKPNPKWEDLQDLRYAYVQDIHRIVEDHPRLYDEAVQWGFDQDLLPDDRNGTRPGDGQRGEGDKGRDRDRDSDNVDRDRNKDTDTTDPTVDGDLLPGQRGKHYQVVRHNGKTYIVYAVKVGGRTIKTSWRVKPGDLDKHGLEEGDGRQITKAQFKNLQVFGTTDEITRRKGGNKHPFKKWIEELQATYGGTSILKNKETLGVLVAGFLEREDPGITEAKLRKTKWYQKRTAYEREWELVKTEAERAKALKRTGLEIGLALDEIYGTVNWRKHIDPNKVDEWALKIASGKWDDPGEALGSLLARQTRRAEKIEGTAAWQAAQEKEINAREFRNRPEEMFEKLRTDAVNWLGYKGRPDNGTLRRWAEDLAFQRKSDAEWQQYMRRTKQALYPYLDPDEAWMDRGSVYKSIAEELLGTTLSWKDKLLGDFVARQPDGSVAGDGKTAMSSWDFEKLVRSDDRFLNSKVGHEEGFGLYNLLNQTFNGVAA